MVSVRVWLAKAGGVFSSRAEPRAVPVSPRKSASGRFPRESKLTRRREFERVLAQGKRRHTRYFTLVAAPRTPTARLGLVIGRRSARRATDRNRLKRIAREAFRVSKLGPLDVVILGRADLERIDRRDLRADLEDGLKDLSKVWPEY